MEELQGVTMSTETTPVDYDDENERPTVPNFRFDTPAEQFFAVGQRAQDVARDAAARDDEELTEWWAAQRRAAHTWWVAALMALCVAMLVFGAAR